MKFNSCSTQTPTSGSFKQLFILLFQFINPIFSLSTLQHGEKSTSYVCFRELFVLTELAV